MQKFGFSTSNAKNGIIQVSDAFFTFNNMRNSEIGCKYIINLISDTPNLMSESEIYR